VAARQGKIQTNQSESKLGERAARTFAVSERMNQLLLEHIDAALWRAKPPGNVRDIAAVFSHMQNVRVKWIRLTAPHLKAPGQLNRAQCTPLQAGAALAESAARCEEMLAEALDGDGRVATFRRDGWGKPWPAGIEMLSYMVAHEAHHRGQVSMLMHQLGFPLSNELTSGMWNWEKLWKELGWPGGPGE
jgi:uncharacterized damage-inducible protein DinB